MTDIERRNATYDAYVQIEAWIKENCKGLWDSRQTYTVTNTNTAACEWELNIEPNGDVYLELNIQNYSNRIEVRSSGFISSDYRPKQEWIWNRDTAKWDCHNATKYEHYAINGMFGTVARWKDIKHWIELRKEKCDALLNFKL